MRQLLFIPSFFGPPQNNETRIKGWKLGDIWLTFFPSEDMGIDPDGNPRIAEFAIQVTAPEEVDVLYNALIKAGATTCRAPEDTRMYDKMRYCCVDEPYGIRIDVYCPI